MREGVEGFTHGPDGCRLRTLSWTVRAPRGRVQVVHGLGEHIGRYRLLAQALNEAGFSAFGHDHRGHGKSEGARGQLGSFDEFTSGVRHLRTLADELAPGPGRPFLVAHSMGGLVAIRLFQTTPTEVGEYQGIVVSAPWLATRVRLPLHVRLALPILRRFAADLPVPRPFNPANLTRDPEQAAAFAKDRLVVRATAVSFVDRITGQQEAALGEGLPGDTPALLIVPEGDPLADPGVTLRWARGLGMRIEAWPLPGTRHEPFNDIDRNNTFERLVEWLGRLADGDSKEHE
jgi:alpha-beta hydrolase superfamily lysophospholipase